MTESTLNLTSQIIILATALVGLIQVLRFKPKMKEKEEINKSKTSSIREYFEPFFGIIGVFAFMLAFPLFTLVFTKVVGMIGNNDFSKQKSTKIELIDNRIDLKNLDSIIINKDLKKYYLGMYFAITSPNSNNTKNALTDSLVNFCINKNELKLAAYCVDNYFNNNDKDDALIKIIDKSIKTGNFDVANYCLTCFSSNNEKDSQSEKIYVEIKSQLTQAIKIRKNTIQVLNTEIMQNDSLKSHNK